MCVARKYRDAYFDRLFIVFKVWGAKIFKSLPPLSQQSNIEALGALSRTVSQLILGCEANHRFILLRIGSTLKNDQVRIQFIDQGGQKLRLENFAHRLDFAERKLFKSELRFEKNEN